jgi:hypothetical protein
VVFCGSLLILTRNILESQTGILSEVMKNSLKCDRGAEYCEFWVNVLHEGACSYPCHPWVLMEFMCFCPRDSLSDSLGYRCAGREAKARSVRLPARMQWILGAAASTRALHTRIASTRLNINWCCRIPHPYGPPIISSDLAGYLAML